MTSDSHLGHGASAGAQPLIVRDVPSTSPAAPSACTATKPSASGVAIAVELFMNDAIPFTAIAGIVEKTLSLDWDASCETLSEVVGVDADARRRARDESKGYIA